MSNSPAIGWCFTINNPTVDDYAQLYKLSQLEQARYLICGQEKVETLHIQGYVEFKVKIRFNQVKNHLSERAHIEKRKGTAKQAAEYCKKENNFVEFGEYVGQGHRTDLGRAQSIAENGGMRQVVECCNVQQILVAQKYLDYHEVKRDWKPFVMWICGSPGAGKTKLAHELCKDKDVYVKNGLNKWWQGYDAHTHVIIDDIRPQGIPLVDLLGIIDRYEFTVECKGGSRQLLATHIYITSVVHPAQLYITFGENDQQLLRRIDEVKVVYTEEEAAKRSTLDQIYDFDDEE